MRVGKISSMQVEVVVRLCVQNAFTGHATRKFYCICFLKTFQSGERSQFWRQYNWIGVHFHKTKSGAKCLTQCVLRSKCGTMLFFKINFVLRDLLDSVKFLVFL